MMRYLSFVLLSRNSNHSSRQKPEPGLLEPAWFIVVLTARLFQLRVLVHQEGCNTLYERTRQAVFLDRHGPAIHAHPAFRRGPPCNYGAVASLRSRDFL